VLRLPPWIHQPVLLKHVYKVHREMGPVHCASAGSTLLALLSKQLL
jgi:hypothetical protein